MANTQARTRPLPALLQRPHDTIVTEDDEAFFYMMQVAPGRPAPHLYEEDHDLNRGDMTFARTPGEDQDVEDYL